MRRVNLDAFWKSESSAVLHNCQQINRCLKTADELGLPQLLPPMGPFPPDDALGMKAALAVLDKSLDKGACEATVQWATFRRMRSAITNFYQASAEGLGDRVGACEKTKTWITGSTMFGFFFSRFMAGIHERVGERVIQDEPISIELMQCIDEHLKAKWLAVAEQHPIDNRKMLKIARQGV